MKSLWVFRSNIRDLEYYHRYRFLQEFKEKSHDFYLLQGIFYLEHEVVDEVVIWRLQPKKKVKDIVFNIRGKEFIQKFVDDFSECLKFPKPFVTLWRGGFWEYDKLTKKHHKFFGSRSLYLGAGRRFFPQYGGKYDIILLEDERDFNKSFKCLPFYKTANPKIFRPISSNKKYDVCWICNFSQVRHKGHEFFVSSVSKSKFLKSLKIVHVGNKPEVGRKLCKKYNVNNIEFRGWLSRATLNMVLNGSRIGIVTSNQVDGCPRVSTEVLMSGIPLLIRDETRLLSYYKKNCAVEFNSTNISEKIKTVLSNYNDYYIKLQASIEGDLSLNNICRMNWKLWTN